MNHEVRMLFDGQTEPKTRQFGTLTALEAVLMAVEAFEDVSVAESNDEGTVVVAEMRERERLHGKSPYYVTVSSRNGSEAWFEYERRG